MIILSSFASSSVFFTSMSSSIVFDIPLPYALMKKLFVNGLNRSISSTVSSIPFLKFIVGLSFNLTGLVAFVPHSESEQRIMDVGPHPT